MAQKQLGPFEGRYFPDYEITVWNDGDPRRRVRGVNLRSIVAIETSKSLDDVSGTFTITLKDRQARHLIREMDVVRIKLRGHDDAGLSTTMRGVVDTVRQAGAADVYASREDSIIEGRCMGKYLQITSLFLPVWDPQGVLPTALIFGFGDAAKKVGGNRPFDIFEYLIQRFTYGKRNLAGVSGVPNSRFWLDYKARFDKVPFDVPFLQFDEDAMSDALKRLEVLGYTEAWIDEVGHVVYRHPQWDQPAKYRIPTGSLTNWDFQRSDVGCATYIEVIPAGDPGIDSAAAQALRAGRAPVPSAYLKGSQTSQMNVGPEFIIETDRKGKVTAKGAQNYWYKRQRRLGLRPQQLSSPLLFTQEQAQAQAEGLLQFYGRMIKMCQVTIPGCPSVRLGESGRFFGELDGLAIDRTYYIDQVSHTYVENSDGGSYTTSLRGSHGRDPWDPKWGKIAIPKYDPAKLSAESGVLAPLAAEVLGSVGGSVTSKGAFVGGIYADPKNKRGQDRGYDFAGAGPMPAFASGVVTKVLATNSGWPLHAEHDGMGALVCVALDKPVKGVSGAVYHYNYYTENFAPAVHEGQRVAAGDVIGHARGVFAFTEQGFAGDRNGNTYASLHGQPRNIRNGAGHDFQVWIGY